MLRRLCLVVTLLVACDGGEMPVAEDAAVDAEVDAQAGDDDGPRPIDGPPVPEPSCMPPATPTPQPGAHVPVAGTYCATWTRQDGVIDAFARYYDRVDITLSGSPGARWWSTGSTGLKDYLAAGAAAGGCFIVDQFVTDDGFSGSGDLTLCWSTQTTAVAAMTWCSSSLDAHWTVSLSACP